jgi:hypothetical protein
MNWLNKLERKIGRYAIPNLMIWLIGANALGYLLLILNANIFAYLTLSPYYILHGQIWRLFTWILIPNNTNLFSLLIMSLLYYQLGSALERTWGTFRFNVYIISGMLFTVVGAFLLYGIEYLIYGGVTLSMATMGFEFSMNYIFLSIFLAFAVMYPDMQVYLMFILPIKMKWMAIVYAVLAVYEVIISDWAGRVSIVMSLLSFTVFFLSTRNLNRYTPHEVKRRRQFKTQMRQPRPGSGLTKHKCAVCGRTELDAPNLEFRFCSKCEGNYEYCSDHLFTHQHIRLH